MLGRVKRRATYRHVTVDDAWQTFSGFLADMGERPNGTTLDRLDNSKGYNKDNCVWSTPLTQGRNTTRVRLSLEKVGKTRELSSAGLSQLWIATVMGVHESTVCQALKGNTWRE